MATDATGTPTTLGIPTYNTQVDAPSGKGFNAAMAAIDTLIVATVTKPSGIVSGEAPVWNGSAFVRSSVTGLTPSGIAGYPADGTKFLAGDGTWKVSTSVITPTHLGPYQLGLGPSAYPIANTAYLIPIRDLLIPFAFTRFSFVVGTSSGNMDLGIYSSTDELTFTRVYSTGSFATPAAGINIKTVATQTITPVTGTRFYIAIAVDNTTATFRALDSQGFAYSKAASFVLPASLTGMTAVAAVTNIPGITLAI